MHDSDVSLYTVKNTNFKTIVFPIDRDKFEGSNFNPNVNDINEKTFQVWIDVLSYVFSKYNIESDVGIMLWDGKKVAGNMVLHMTSKSISKLFYRSFSEKEYSDLLSGEIISPPVYPLRRLFDEGKVLVLEMSSEQGAKGVYSNNKTKIFKSYLKKHMFENYYVEQLVDEAYDEFLDLKKKVFGCSANNNIECIKKYLKYGYDINEVDPKNDQTLLIYAAVHGATDVAKFLVANGADVNQHPRNHESAYLSAVRLGHSDIALFLAPFTHDENKNVLSRSDNSSICYQLDNASDVSACLGDIHATNNEDVKKIILGECYSLSGWANDNGLREVCVNKISGCYSLSDADDVHTCVSCNGSNQWLRMYAIGHVMSCF